MHPTQRVTFELGAHIIVTELGLESREVAKGNSDVITTMTSLSLKGSPMNVYSLATSLIREVARE